jgi:3-dehydroquinate synthase II
MEVWLRSNDGSNVSGTDRFDRILWATPHDSNLHVKGTTLFQGNSVLGAYVHVRDGATQQTGIAHMGTVDWILVECETWSMIPLENLIAHRKGSHTKIAAMISTPLEAQGAGFALQEGVDALVIPTESTMIEAALSIKAQRLEQTEPESKVENTSMDSVDLSTFTVESIEEAGLGDRYCLDFLSLFSQNEGVLVGSSAQSLFLIHSETIPSTFVPTRPFRVNAGSPHSYIMMADGSTKYLAELSAGDVALAVNASGVTRGVVLGRIKIEQRPMLKISCKFGTKSHQNDNTSHIFMQQAETVRLITETSAAVSVTDLTHDQRVLGWEGHSARHVGVAVGGEIEER